MSVMAGGRQDPASPRDGTCWSLHGEHIFIKAAPACPTARGVGCGPPDGGSAAAMWAPCPGASRASPRPRRGRMAAVGPLPSAESGHGPNGRTGATVPMLELLAGGGGGGGGGHAWERRHTGVAMRYRRSAGHTTRVRRRPGLCSARGGTYHVVDALPWPPFLNTRILYLPALAGPVALACGGCSCPGVSLCAVADPSVGMRRPAASNISSSYARCSGVKGGEDDVSDVILVVGSSSTATTQRTSSLCTLLPALPRGN